MLTKNQKVEIVNKFGKNTIPILDPLKFRLHYLTERINSLTDHLRSQPKGLSVPARGLLKLVGQRRNFMSYLKNRKILKRVRNHF